MKPTNGVYTGLPTTIFETMSRLARAHDAVNLGQGFPDTDGPADILKHAAEAIEAGPNQYPPMMGLPALRAAAAANWRRFHGLDVDPEREVLVTSGATEALSDAIAALIEPGDEVVLIEPLYDCYLPLIRRAGGVPRLVRLAPPDWALGHDALAAAFSARTKAVLVNNPLNPAAKAFTDEELAMIAEQAIRHDAYVIADEVYEHIVFDGRRPRSFLALEGLRERTLAIGSAGKSFSLTGWKVGTVTGAPALLDPVIKAHQFTTFTTPPHLQSAVAYGLAKEASYFTGLAADLQAKRDRLGGALRSHGLPVLPCGGTYFLSADFGGMVSDASDAALAERLTREAGVAAIPLSAFYAGEPPPGRVLRFCFAKRDAVLDEAAARLGAWLASARRDAA